MNIICIMICREFIILFSIFFHKQKIFHNFISGKEKEKYTKILKVVNSQG